MQPSLLPALTLASKRQQAPAQAEVPDVAFRWHVAGAEVGDGRQSQLPS